MIAMQVDIGDWDAYEEIIRHVFKTAFEDVTDNEPCDRAVRLSPAEGILHLAHLDGQTGVAINLVAVFHRSAATRTDFDRWRARCLGRDHIGRHNLKLSSR